MQTFFRTLAAFLVGAVVGAGIVLYQQPTFSIVVTNAPAAVTTLVDNRQPVVEEPEFVPPPAPVATVGGSAKAPTPAAPSPATPDTPAPIDYAQVAARPSFWPAEVQAVVASVITFTEDGKKTDEMKIAAGTPLQLSGVQQDGTLELRAQGRKFNLHARFTDFDSLVRKKAQELVARATGLPAAEPASPASPSAPAPVAVVPVVTPAKPKGPLTLQQKLDALYGRTAEPAVEPAPAPAAPSPSAPVSPAPQAPAPAAPSAEPAPAGDKAAKDADLKQRMDGLFKPAATPAK